jgi:hypothetical protein
VSHLRPFISALRKAAKGSVPSYLLVGSKDPVSGRTRRGASWEEVHAARGALPWASAMMAPRTLGGSPSHCEVHFGSISAGCAGVRKSRAFR